MQKQKSNIIEEEKGGSNNGEKEQDVDDALYHWTEQQEEKEEGYEAYIVRLAKTCKDVLEDLNKQLSQTGMQSSKISLKSIE